MPAPINLIAFALFVPGDRPDRLAKAFLAGADAVIIDLEDAVADAAKPAARKALSEARAAIAAAPCAVLVRVNAAGTLAHAADVQALAGLALAGIMLPKAETVAEVEATEKASRLPVLVLIESARGIAAARQLAQACARLAFGSIDYAADLGCAHTRDALLTARAELVLASRLAGRPAPIDGVTVSTRDAELVRADAAYAAALGFGGKLIIHPAQLKPAALGFCPADDEVAWAKRVLEAGADKGAALVDGGMIDAPVRARAQQILQRWSRFETVKE